MGTRSFIYKHPTFYKVIFIVAFTVSLSLFIAGFFVPPMGEIDGSVLKAAGILLGFATLAMIPNILESGRRTTLRHGDTELIIGEDGIEEEASKAICGPKGDTEE